MIQEILTNLVQFKDLTFYSDALWIILPLFLSTLLMMLYFGIYREEKTEWDSHLSNSFVLIFVSIALLRYIYSIDAQGLVNYVEYVDKFIATVFLLGIGYTLMKFSFEHLLPKKISRYVNSPLTVNLFAYAIVLFVYSTIIFTWHSYLALLILIILLIGFLILVKIPARRISEYMKKEKEKERIENVRERAFRIRELKEDLESQEKELKNLKINEVEKKKKEAVKLNKILRKVK